MKKLDIHSKSENVIARDLSNFAKHEFIFRGFRIISAESVLQAVKYKNPYQQMYALTVISNQAQKEGSSQDWKQDKKLYWFGYSMDRYSEEYQDFIDELYICLLKNENFKNTLLESKEYELIHSIGNNNPDETILTEREFCNRLMIIRDYLLKGKKYDEEYLRKHLKSFHGIYLKGRNYLNTIKICKANKLTHRL